MAKKGKDGKDWCFCTRNPHERGKSATCRYYKASGENTVSGRIDVGKLVRGIAREKIGAPGKTKVVPDRRRKKLDEIRDREHREETKNG